MTNKQDKIDKLLQSIPKPTLQLGKKRKMYEKIISPKEAFTDKVLVLLLSLIFIYLGFTLLANIVSVFIIDPIYNLLNLLPIGNFNNAYQLVTALIFLVVIVIGSYVLAGKVSDYITFTFRKSFRLKLLLTIVMAFLISHKFMAPYFYTDNYLKNRAEQLIELRYEMYDGDRTEEELKKLAKKVYINSGSHVIFQLEHYQQNKKLFRVEGIGLERRYGTYFYRVAVTESSIVNGEEKIETHYYTYTFQSERGRFYMNGYSMN